MPRSKTITPENFIDFGELLKYLRRREELSQRDVAIAVGYSDSQISRLEHSQRIPDQAVLTALFIPALHLEYEPEWAGRLLQLASEARRQEHQPQHEVVESTTTHNLPSQPTNFLGRSREIKLILDAIGPEMIGSDPALQAPSRLVTLTGPGGVGKTRLALQAASRLLDRFPGGVWMADLAPLTDPSLVVQAVASSFDLGEYSQESLIDRLTAFVGSKKLLLLLDNCEHLVSACASLVDALRHACPAICILATGREALGLAGETVLIVEPLSVPAPDQPDWLDSDAVRLFIDRARSADPAFDVTPENSRAIVQVCQRLDGLPLAIELAAARVRAYSVEQIAARLDDVFSVLGAGNRAAALRSQTLHACFDWSYELLSEAERSLLQRLAVFNGGWTLEAAEEICSGEPIPASAVFSLLAQLVEKSWVVVDRQEVLGRRYHFLETISQYAREKLIQADEQVVLKNKHMAYFLRYAEESFETRILAEVEWLKRIEAEYDNLRAALDWSMTGDIDLDLVFRLAIKLGVFWERRGYYDEGRQRLARVLSLSGADVPSLARAELLFQSAWLSILQGDRLAGSIILEQSRIVFEQFRPDGLKGLSDVLNSLAVIENDNGEAAAALEYAQKALKISEDIRYEVGISWSQRMIGLAFGHQGDYARAGEHLEIALAMDRKLGKSLMNLLLTLGEVAIRQGDDEKARQHLDECLRLGVEAGNRWNIAAALGSLGWISLRKGELIQARRLLNESLLLRMEIGDRGGTAWCLEKFADLALLGGAPGEAVRLLASATALRQVSHSPLNSADLAEFNRLLDSLRGPQFDLNWQAGTRMPLDDAVRSALDLNLPH